MCGIAGMIHLAAEPISNLKQCLAVASHLLRHRGPDGFDQWQHDRGHVGFAHRLSLIHI